MSNETTCYAFTKSGVEVALQTDDTLTLAFGPDWQETTAQDLADYLPAYELRR